jgi:hypothetical protein
LGNKRCRGSGAQASIESMMILAAAMAGLLIFTALIWDSYSGSQILLQQQSGKNLIESLSREIDDAYFLGPGTVKKLILQLPESYDFNKSEFIGKTIVLNVAGSDIIGTTNVEVRGSWPDDTGLHQFVITVYDGFVSISPSKLSLSQHRIAEIVSSSSSKEVVISAENISGAQVPYVISTEFLHPDASAIVSPSGEKIFDIDESADFTISLSCDSNASGAYSGELIFSGDENTSLPIDLVCVSSGQELVISPSVKLIESTSSGESFLVCNNSSTNFSSSDSIVSGNIAAYSAVTFSGVIASGSCEELLLRINPSIPPGAYSGFLVVSSSGFTARANLSMVVS